METEGSLPYSQVPATCPYPEPTPSSPHELCEEISLKKAMNVSLRQTTECMNYTSPHAKDL
jgi:hypothetical protein